MSWQAEIEELERRTALGQAMGGPEKIKRHHDAGKLTVRERIAALVDAGSFYEIGCWRERPSTTRRATSSPSLRPISCWAAPRWTAGAS